MNWLPGDLTTESYLASCFQVLSQWSWLYQEKNTKILQAGILDSPTARQVLPYISRLEVTDLNEVPFGFTQEDWPDTLKAFVKNCWRLRPKLEQFKLRDESDLVSHSFRRMSPKKREEVLVLSQLVADSCQKKNIRHVVDFGSGLGYVDRLLVGEHGLRVLGLERDESRVEAALRLGGGVEYQVAALSEESLEAVGELINSWLGGAVACFMALHSCGDLSVLIGRLFGRLQLAQVLILTPCCYHRSVERPLTSQLRSAGGGELMSTTLLRLASDATAERWRSTSPESHLRHARCLLARALVELSSDSETGQMKKVHRHLFQTAATETWEKCLEKCLREFPGVKREKLEEVWRSSESRTKEIESFSCLQVCLQGIAEGLVLLDTFLFLKEVTNGDVALMRVFDVVVSPRSVAFIVDR